MRQAPSDEILAIQLLNLDLPPAHTVRKPPDTAKLPAIDATVAERVHQIPLSLPVIRKATAAADAR